MWNSGGRVEFQSMEVDDGYLTPGETEDVILSVFNYGWGVSEETEVEITTTDPYITINNGSATTDSLLKRTGAEVPLVVEVDAGCPIGHEVEFTVNVAQDEFVRTETVELVVGEPVIYFSDDAESGMGNWNVSYGWGQCASNPYQGNFSFAESPTGNYTNNTTRIMTLDSPVDLTDANTVWLEFYTRYDIENNYDFGQVEISTNGSNWTPLAGDYTVSGSGIGVQPAGQPGYEGTQASWVREIMDLNTYAGQSSVWIRFEFRSDGGVVGDGWFVDNIKIAGFEEPITPLDMTVTLEPETLPIVIPPGGGSFDFSVTIENNESFTVDFDAWTDVELPDGSIYGPIILRTNLSLEVSGSVLREITQAVPAGAPSGDYEFRAHVGQYPNTVFAEDSFPFSKED